MELTDLPSCANFWPWPNDVGAAVGARVSVGFDSLHDLLRTAAGLPVSAARRFISSV